MRNNFILTFVFLLSLFLIMGYLPGGFSAREVISQVYAQEANESISESDLKIPSPTVVEKKSEYEEKLGDYTQKLEEYKRAHDVYVVARAQYIRSKTQKSKTDAKDASVKVLELRDDVVIAYLITLKTRLGETKGVGDARYQALTFKVDEEIAWYKQHKSLISSAGSLEDLVGDSEKAEERQKLSERIYYEVLSNISYGKVNNYKERSRENLESLREIVDDIRVDEREGYSFSNRKMQVLDRWILESENLITRTEDKQNEADEGVAEIVEKKFATSTVKQFNGVIIKLTEAKQFLKEASSYLTEVIKEIKIAEDD